MIYLSAWTCTTALKPRPWYGNTSASPDEQHERARLFRSSVRLPTSNPTCAHRAHRVSRFLQIRKQSTGLAPAGYQQLLSRTRAGHIEERAFISVDAKKKELVGNFQNAGREWHPQYEPELVDVHDFPNDTVGKAVPYGIYDVAANDGFVNVGTDHDTPVFAVTSSRPGGSAWAPSVKMRLSMQSNHVAA